MGTPERKDTTMRILVIGATGRSGRAVCDAPPRPRPPGDGLRAFRDGHDSRAIVSIASTATPPMPSSSSASCPDTTPSSSPWGSPNPPGGCGCSAHGATAGRHPIPRYRRRGPGSARLGREPTRRADLLRGGPDTTAPEDRGADRLRPAAEAPDARHRAAGAGRASLRARVDTRAAGVPHRRRGRHVRHLDRRADTDTRVSRGGVAAVHADLVESGAHRHDTVSVSG